MFLPNDTGGRGCNVTFVTLHPRPLALLFFEEKAEGSGAAVNCDGSAGLLEDNLVEFHLLFDVFFYPVHFFFAESYIGYKQYACIYLRTYGKARVDIVFPCVL